MTTATDGSTVAGSRRRRFGYRPKRLARRAERDAFSFFIVPLIWLLLLLGASALLFAAVYHSVTGDAGYAFFVWAALPVLVALLLWAFRLVRGHYSSALNEP